MKALVLTVGQAGKDAGSTTPDLTRPEATAIQKVRDDLDPADDLLVVFLCSPLSKSYAAGFANLLGLQEEQRWIAEIEHYDHVQACYDAAREQFARIEREHPSATLLADYTGGTKSMTAGLVLASVEHPRCQLNIVDGRRGGSGQVIPGTDYFRPVDVGGILARRQVDLARRRIERYDYAAATAVLGVLRSETRDPSARAAIQRAWLLCAGFDAWDRFDHTGAIEKLALCGDDAGEWLPALAELARANPHDPYLRVDDLLFNAERRADQQRYDDAVARVYRALELLAQTRLKDKHKIDTSDVDLKRVPESFSGRDALTPNRNGKTQVGLEAAWSMLAEFESDPLGEWHRDCEKQLRTLLQARNQSILAHGATPIARSTWDQHGAPAIERLRDALTRVPKRGKLRAKQLPRRLDSLDDL